jgi:hypothetical protein
MLDKHEVGSAQDAAETRFAFPYLASGRPWLWTESLVLAEALRQHYGLPPMVTAELQAFSLLLGYLQVNKPRLSWDH